MQTLLNISACTRGSPEYDVRATFIEETPVTGCSQTATCGANYECKTIGSVQWCCPSVGMKRFIITRIFYFDL